MRYANDHKATSRANLLAASAAYVKTHGFAASGVDAISKSAGMTSGALYKHFEGKAEFFAALITRDLGQTTGRFTAIATKDKAAAKRALAAYLSLAHVENSGHGCPLPALTAEVARSDERTRQALQEGLSDAHRELARLTTTGQKAWSLIAQCVGAVMLARAMNDKGLQATLLDAVTRECTSLL
jgi:TetR/AcrR family transcriptional regulator, transcriptional repressor for nem operon